MRKVRATPGRTEERITDEKKIRIASWQTEKYTEMVVPGENIPGKNLVECS